ncbi:MULTISPECIES: acyltransferase family protein [unclassified Saccharicrinis]|uniref:acyltransferase family protein n=1 Tax=unclassified Saccharicrinis TaxID=2646859 RepID=UPI003D34556A
MEDRRYDIDWLRVIAIGLLLIYHIAIVFQPWAVFIGFLQSKESLESIWIPMSMLNVWRIPILFFVSGMGVAFAMRKRSWKQLLLERTKRILIPFVAGILLIVPLHWFIFQDYYSQQINYNATTGHLWFLGNIFIYVLILSPLFFWIKKIQLKNSYTWLSQTFKSPLGLLLITLTFIAETMLFKPTIFEMYATTSHGFAFGFIAFFWGFCTVISGLHFLETTKKWRWVLLALSSSLFAIRLILFELKAPNYIMSLESALWIFTVFGFSARYLNRPNKKLTYLSAGAYPIYIWHMVFLYLGSYFILPIDIPAWTKLLLISAFTFGGCFLFYEILVRRNKVLRPLFGMK